MRIYISTCAIPVIISIRNVSICGQRVPRNRHQRCCQPEITVVGECSGSTRGSKNTALVMESVSKAKAPGINGDVCPVSGILQAMAMEERKLGMTHLQNIPPKYGQ